MNDQDRSRLTHVQIKRKLASYHDAGMNAKRDVTTEFHSNPTEPAEASPFQLVSQSACIINIPPPMLDSIITKATSLLSTPGNVIPTPGASDGSYIVARFTMLTLEKVDHGHVIEPALTNQLKFANMFWQSHKFPGA